LKNGYLRKSVPLVLKIQQKAKQRHFLLLGYDSN